MSYRRPHFVREESWRYKRVRESWRSPRGKTSRVRRSKEGWPPVVKVGYARPKAQRGEHPSGLTEVMVRRPKDLEGIDPKTQVARIAHTVGERKRVDILDQAKKANIRVLNPGQKKEAEVAPQPAPEAAEPTTAQEPTAPEGLTTETTTQETSEETEPETKAKETETTKEPPKKREKSKKTKEKRSEK